MSIDACAIRWYMVRIILVSGTVFSCRKMSSCGFLPTQWPSKQLVFKNAQGGDEMCANIPYVFFWKWNKL